MHYPLEGTVLISGHGAYQTPLGPVMIAREACRVLDDALRQELGAGLTPVKGDPEHSIEIELPFLQRVLPEEWRLLPVMVRDQRREVARALGLALAVALRDRAALLVASTDLSHYHPPAAANPLHREPLPRVEAFDPAALPRAQPE